LVTSVMFGAYLKSYFRSRRFIVIFPIYVILSSIGIIFTVSGITPKPPDIYQYTSNELQNYVFASSLLAGIFAGDAISRDFSREGFFTLTQPVSRTKIFLSRMIASLVACSIIMFIDFFVLGLSFGYYLYGEVVPDVYLIVAFGFFFILAVVSLALLFSSLFKSQVVSGIVTTLVLWFVMPTISGLLQFVNFEPWFLLNYAGSVIQDLAMKNYPPHYQQISIPTSNSQITLHIFNPTLAEAAVIILAYTVMNIITGIIIYRRKELKEV
jgi:ABC-2 type transport system permease protein